MSMDTFFDRALAAARQLGASDIHLKPGLHPMLRVAASCARSTTTSPGADARLSPQPGDVAAQRSAPRDAGANRRRDGGAGDGQRGASAGAHLAAARRHRHRDAAHPAGGAGARPAGAPGGPRDLLAPGGGLVLVASGPGGGKTTTLAAMVDDLGARYPLHIITIEDPVELLLKDRQSVVVQREVGLDVPTSAAGLRAAARQDADVLMVGELGDGETAELALAAAENGRLVLAGVIAGSAATAVARLASCGTPRAARRPRPPEAALRGVLHQRLVTPPNGKGRTAEAELLTPPRPEMQPPAMPGTTAPRKPIARPRPKARPVVVFTPPMSWSDANTVRRTFLDYFSRRPTSGGRERVARPAERSDAAVHQRRDEPVQGRLHRQGASRRARARPPRRSACARAASTTTSRTWAAPRATRRSSRCWATSRSATTSSPTRSRSPRSCSPSVYGIDPKRLVYTGARVADDEARALWRKVAGVGDDRIISLGDKDNFWPMGETGPCGPCSEIHFFQGDDIPCAIEASGGTCAGPACDCDRWVEIWNLVFMQYEQVGAGRPPPAARSRRSTPAWASSGCARCCRACARTTRPTCSRR